MKHYDIIIAGSGAAGLSLAYHLSRSPLRERSILIVDKCAKDCNDRTWAFWADQPTPFESIVYRSWNRLQVVGDDLDASVDLRDYRYQMIRGIDFYAFVRQELAAFTNIIFLQGVVERIEDGADAARVIIDGQAYTAEWVFDSIFKPSEIRDELADCEYLKLYFKGWEIETDAPIFNPDAATLMDFRTPQKNETRFFYVLPFSPTRALVEFTVFSAARFSQRTYEQALRDYLADTLGVSDFRIVAEESGVIPATDYDFTRQLGRRVMTIGTKAGRVKPTTGYAFLRILQDSAAIVASLVANGHPFDVPADRRAYRWLDAVMLRVMRRHGEQLKPIFTALFRRNPIERIFRFLDERASLWESLRLIASLPPWTFMRTAFQMRSTPQTQVQPQPQARSTTPITERLAGGSI